VGKGGGGAGEPGFGEAARDVDNSPDGLRLSSKSEGDEGAERDLDQGDAAGIYTGQRGDVGQGVGGGGEPERNVDTVLDESRSARWVLVRSK
jgi:hypothetical protein